LWSLRIGRNFLIGRSHSAFRRVAEAGAISYHRRWPDPYPSVFGYHEVFHVFVCAAATCQYLAIALFIV
jgi:Haemolysin-III related